MALVTLSVIFSLVFTQFNLKSSDQLTISELYSVNKQKGQWYTIPTSPHVTFFELSELFKKTQL
jgi:hypothetical protein